MNDLFGPPPPEALRLKRGSQTWKIYRVLLDFYHVPHYKYGIRAPISTILDYCPTTNHRARVCRLRELLREPKTIEAYGKWTIPHAEGKGSNSSYWLERV